MEFSTKPRPYAIRQKGYGASDATVETALDWAEVAAMLGDFREAVSWLEYVEWLSGILPPELAALRKTWTCAAGLETR